MSIVEELSLVEDLIKYSDPLVSSEVLERINVDGKEYPIYGFTIGTQDPEAPCLGVFGGVHGLERVGTHVVISYLTTLFKQMTWDQDLRSILKHSRICAIPLINPGGMQMHRRSNPNGVDLMRNSPVESDPKSHTFLVSGHRISPRLPWYRGKEGAPMEVEANVVIDFVKKNMFQSSTSLSLDFHSGFGLRDRLWFPYAFSDEYFPREEEAANLHKLLDETIPYHIYRVEPQSDSYTIAGDLWDHIFMQHQLSNEGKNKVYIPWTLEMGSWRWVKKNPIQLFTRKGLFNPIKRHRYSRTMRRHLLLIDFFYRAVRNGEVWSKQQESKLVTVERFSEGVKALGTVL